MLDAALKLRNLQICTITRAIFQRPDGFKLSHFRFDSPFASLCSDFSIGILGTT